MSMSLIPQLEQRKLFFPEIADCDAFVVCFFSHHYRNFYCWEYLSCHSKWAAHYPIRPASLDSNAQTKTVYGSSPIVVCSCDTNKTGRTEVPTAQTWSSQRRCIKSTTIELTTFNPQGLFIVRFQVMSSTPRLLCQRSIMRISSIKRINFLPE